MIAYPVEPLGPKATTPNAVGIRDKEGTRSIHQGVTTLISSKNASSLNTPFGPP